jgi:hypothetical protein
MQSIWNFNGTLLLAQKLKRKQSTAATKCKHDGKSRCENKNYQLPPLAAITSSNRMCLLLYTLQQQQPHKCSIFAPAVK